MSKVRSAKGEVVDFDLLKIKNNLQKKDKTPDVQMRERYIEVKRRRNPKRSVSDLVAEQKANEEAFREKLAKNTESNTPKPTETAEPQRKGRSRIVKNKKAEETETPVEKNSAEETEDDGKEDVIDSDND